MIAENEKEAMLQKTFKVRVIKIRKCKTEGLSRLHLGKSMFGQGGENESEKNENGSRWRGKLLILFFFYSAFKLDFRYQRYKHFSNNL